MFLETPWILSIKPFVPKRLIRNEILFSSILFCFYSFAVDESKNRLLYASLESELNLVIIRFCCFPKLFSPKNSFLS